MLQDCHKQRKREEVVVACFIRGGVLEACSGFAGDIPEARINY